MPKAILVANTDWYLYNFRLALARYLREQGYEVLLVSPQGKFVPLLEADGFRWIHLKLGRQSAVPWDEVCSFIQIARIYCRERPDLVHHFTIKPVLYGSLAARLTGTKKIVNSITGLGYVFIGKDRKARRLRYFVKLSYRFVLKRSHVAAIFENESDRRFFIQEGLIPLERTWLIKAGGVNTDYFVPMQEVPGVPLVVLPARMLWDKGVGVLVEAARLLKGLVKARFALVGQPDPGNPASIEQNILRRWEEDGIIEWWGWQSDMNSVYKECHIVTLPSVGEGAPSVLMEAAACGRPVVTTDTPGCRDMVKAGISGLIVPPNDAAALAEALSKLISDPDLRARMGNAGRKLAVEEFSNVYANQATLGVYRAHI